MLHSLNLFLYLTLLPFVFSSSIDYTNQQSWGGSCTSGTKQSPIDITASDIKCSDYDTFALNLNPASQISFHYSDNDWKPFGVLTKTFGTLEAEDINGVVQVYNAFSASLHVPAEHSINGVQHQAELQLEFNLDRGKTRSITDYNKAIISIPLDKTTADKDTQSFLDALDIFTTEETQEGKVIHVKMNELMRKLLVPVHPQNILMYQGSMTKPSCEETVNWYVLENPLVIRDDELDFLLNAINSGNKVQNNRTIQPTNGRQIQKICSVTSRIRTMFQNPAFYFLTILIIAGYLFWHSYGRLPPEHGKTLYANIWTIHPIVSIVYIPNKESFSRRCRIALLYVTLMVQMVIECLAFRIAGYYKERYVLYFAILGILFSIPATYAVGFFFRMYSKRANENERLMHYDITGMVRYRRTFKLATLCTLAFGVLLLYWQMVYLVGILATEWILCFIVGVGIDLCVLDFIAVILSMKFEKWASVLKLRGYYFDGDISFYNIL